MKAIIVDESSPDRTLLWQETPDPTPAAGEVLVAVHATALNRADLFQRAGNYPPPPGASPILGLEAAGVIAALGAGVTGWDVGDAVCALLPGGGYAEKVTVPAAMLMPIPLGWSMAQAAALPEVYLTAWVNIYAEAALQPGEVLLVHGGASGVGTAAIQLAVMSGNPVIVTAGSDEKCATCMALGATAAINYRTQEWAEAVREAAPQGVDVILDMVGADYLSDNLALLRLRGRLVFISTLSGGVAQIDIRQLMGRRLRLIGSVLRSRSPEEKVAIRDGFLEQFGAGLADGRLTPVIDSVYMITQANEAHARMAENRNTGKIVLAVR
jgi:putative PIG3 family NAD(P)H quinone oxidoreductase